MKKLVEEAKLMIDVLDKKISLDKTNYELYLEKCKYLTLLKRNTS